MAPHDEPPSQGLELCDYSCFARLHRNGQTSPHFATP